MCVCVRERGRCGRQKGWEERKTWRTGEYWRQKVNGRDCVFVRPCVCACAGRTLLHNGKTTWQGASISVLQTRQFNKDCILRSAALNWKRRVIDCLRVSSCLLKSWVCCVLLRCVAKCPSPLKSVVKLLAYTFCLTRLCGCFIKHRFEGAICKTWPESLKRSKNERKKQQC